MKIRLLSVGKPRDRLAAALHDRYAERFAGLGVDYRADQVPEVAGAGRYSDEHVRQREARLLNDALDGRGRLIALAADGQSVDSVALSRLLQPWLNPQATFVIGGPLGLHPDFLARANWCWSLSRLTLPHELARVVAVEQLYRAVTVWKGVPYHK